jgi:folate-binding protein YgfZ
MTSAKFLAAGTRGVLSVSGEDRVAFLQGLISNDVTKVAADRAIYAGFLTAQGRFLHDFFVATIGDTLYLDCEAARLDDLRRRLSLYRLRSKVSLAAVPDFAVALLYGAEAPGALRLAEERGAAEAFAGGVVFVDPRLPALGVRAIVPRAQLDAFAKFAPGSAEDYEALRLSLGVPDGSRDLPVEKALLLENGFDELNGVDWKKGCYVGQELTARMKYRLLVKKRLTPVAIDGPSPAPGTTVLLDAEEAGEMRSVQGARGLAMLRLEKIEQAEREGKVLKAGEAGIRPLKPAWAAQ